MQFSYQFKDYGPNDPVPLYNVAPDDESEWGKWAKAHNASAMKCLKKHGRDKAKSNEDWAKELGL